MANYAGYANWHYATSNSATLASAFNTYTYAPIVATVQPSDPTVAPKKTVLDWLDQRVNEMCSVAREALAA